MIAVKRGRQPREPARHARHYKRQELRFIEQSAPPAARAFSSLLPGSAPDHHVAGLLAHRPGHLAAQALRSSRRPRRGSSRPACRSARRPCPASGPAGASTAVTGRRRSSRRPPPAWRRASRLRGSSKNHRRSAAATTGPTSGTACRASRRLAGDGVHRPQVPRQHLRPALADVADAQPVEQPPHVVAAASGRSRPAGWPPTSSPSARAPSSWPAVERVEVGELVDQPCGRRADRRATRPAPRCSWRRAQAKCSRLRLQPRRAADCSRTARPPRPRRGAAGCRTPGSASASPTARGRAAPSASTGPTTRGMTSPAFSMMTVSPSRMSLRATSSALCSVAIEIVEPATSTGSSTA